jgi:hypothetical protein
MDSMVDAGKMSGIARNACELVHKLRAVSVHMDVSNLREISRNALGHLNEQRLALRGRQYAIYHFWRKPEIIFRRCQPIDSRAIDP